MTGAIIRILEKEPAAYAGLLGKAMPLQLRVSHDHQVNVVFEDLKQVAAELRRRGLPVRSMARHGW
jgi:hypothetical protein